MYKKIFLITLLCIGCSFGHFDFYKVDKMIVIKSGYKYILNHTFSYNIGPHSPFLGLDVSWEVLGFGKKASAYITIPLNFTYISGDKNSFMLNYGWTIRHNLAMQKKFIPYIGYSLMLNQLYFENIAGKIFGHETVFSFGYIIKERLFLETGYSMINYPALMQKKAYQLNMFYLNAGIKI